MPCVGSALAARGLRGGAAGSLARILAGVCARAGQTRIGDTGGSYPDRERARSNPHRGHGRVKSETGKDGTKKKKPTWGCWFLPAAFNWGFNQGFYWAAKHLGFYQGFYLGLAASGFYPSKNLGRSPGVKYRHLTVAAMLYTLSLIEWNCAPIFFKNRAICRSCVAIALADLCTALSRRVFSYLR